VVAVCSSWKGKWLRSVFLVHFDSRGSGVRNGTDDDAARSGGGVGGAQGFGCGAFGFGMVGPSALSYSMGNGGSPKLRAVK
jgi:hypothetical protein